MTDRPSPLPATEILGHFSRAIAEMVAQTNAGTEISPQKSAAEHERLFTLGLPAFMAELEQLNPGGARRVREYLRMAEAA
jgi:hypothetical protein